MLKEAAERHSECGRGVEAWFQVSRRANWRTLDDVRKTYPHADAVSVKGKTLTVFNIGGNKFRLIVKIEYEYQKIFIKHVLTHAEYDKQDWKK